MDNNHLLFQQKLSDLEGGMDRSIVTSQSTLFNITGNFVTHFCAIISTPPRKNADTSSVQEEQNTI